MAIITKTRSSKDPKLNDPNKIQAIKIAENAKKQGIFIPQAQLNKIGAGVAQDKSAGIQDINKISELNPTGSVKVQRQLDPPKLPTTKINNKLNAFTKKAISQGFKVNKATGEIINPSPELIKQFNQQFKTTFPDTTKTTPPTTKTSTTTPLPPSADSQRMDTLKSTLKNLGFGVGSFASISKKIQALPNSARKEQAQAALAALSDLSIKTGSQPTLTDPSVQERAEASLASDQEDLFEKGKELFGDESPIEPSSLDEKVDKTIAQRKADKMLKEQAEDLEFQEAQAARAEALDVSQFGRLSKQVEAALGSTRAAFAQGREGVISGAASPLIKEFNAEMSTRIKEANIRLESARASRDNILTQLKRAQERNQESLVEAYSKQLANAENEIRQADTNYLNSVANVSQQAMNLQVKQAQISNQAFKSFETLPAGSLVDMDTATIADLFGVDQVTASTLKSLDTNRSTLDVNDPLYDLKKAKIDKQINEAKTAGMSADQKNFMFAQTLKGKEKEQFLTWSSKNPTYKSIKVGNKIFSFDPNTGSINQVAGGTTGGEKIAPSGKFETDTVNGKSVTLDSSALFGLKAANGAAIEDGFGGINITSSTRDQKQTILTMASKWGVEVNADSPSSVNQAAAKLTSMGHPVAAVGQSNHEFGLAIDVYPSDPASQSSGAAQAYIAKIKPYLEAKGWKQSSNPSDRGHFNFVGMTMYSPEQKAVMNSINMKKYDGTDAKSLESADLTYGDLATFRSTQGLTPQQKIQAETVKTKTTVALNNIEKILEEEGLLSAAGRSALIPGISKVSLDYNDLVAALDNIESNIALDAIKSLKEASPTGSTGFGAMNEKELTLLTSSLGTLRPNMSEEALKENLESIRTILQKVNGISNDPASSPEKREVKVITDPVQIQNIYTELQKLQSENVPESEMKATLENKGIDSTQFFN